MKIILNHGFFFKYSGICRRPVEVNDPLDDVEDPLVDVGLTEVVDNTLNVEVNVPLVEEGLTVEVDDNSMVDDKIEDAELLIVAENWKRNSKIS